jgi:hypothetical protein
MQPQTRHPIVTGSPRKTLVEPATKSFNILDNLLTYLTYQPPLASEGNWPSWSIRDSTSQNHKLVSRLKDT